MLRVLGRLFSGSRSAPNVLRPQHPAPLWPLIACFTLAGFFGLESFGAVLAAPAANFRLLPESANANALRSPRNCPGWRLEHREDCNSSLEERALDRLSLVALGPGASAMTISPARACPRTSIFGRRSADRTNTTARLPAGRSCIVWRALALLKERPRLTKRRR